MNVSKQKQNNENVNLEEKQYVPEIRFPQFNNNWAKIFLNKISVAVKEKNKDNQIITVFSNSAKKGIVLQEDFFDKNIANKTNLTGYYIVKPNDFVYNPRISNYAPVGPIKQNKTGLTGIVSPLYSVFRLNEEYSSEFMQHYFTSTKWYKYIKGVANYGARHDRINITQKDLYNLPIVLPSLEEQDKIANFLSSIDKKIELLEKTLVLYQKHNQKTLNNIFYSLEKECQFKYVKDIFKIISSKNYQIKSSEILDYGLIPVIDQGKDFISGYSNNNSKICTIQPLIIFGDHTTNLKFIDFNFIVGGDGVKILKSRNKDLSLKYLYYSLINYNVSQDGYKRHFSLLKEVELPIPSFERQKEIEKTLNLFSNKVKFINKELYHLKKFKKGLLQKMFV